MKKVTVTIRHNDSGQVQEFETNAVLGSFIGKEMGEGTETGSFLIGQVNRKELLKLSAAFMALIHRATDDVREATAIIELATQLAEVAHVGGHGEESTKPKR